MGTPSPPFVSVFKINEKPILSPVITDKLREEIKAIRNECKLREEKLKHLKDLANEATKNDLMRSRSDSYTISSPIFAADQLPEINSVKEHPEKDEAPTSLESSIAEELAHDDEVHSEKGAEVSDKLTRDEFVERNVSEVEPKTPLPTDSYDLYQPEFKSQIQDLIKKQKEEYLDTVNVLKKRFFGEQQLLLKHLQTSMQNITSTPLQNVSIAPTEDEEFTEFQTCLQSVNNLDEDSTLTSSKEKEKAATIINAYARGYLIRRLLKTIYVQECISNIQSSLKLILALDGEKLKSSGFEYRLIKMKIYVELQSDLYRLHDVFFILSMRDRMELISRDRERHVKKKLENFHEITM